MKKRILSILLAVALLLSVGVVPARAADSCVSVKADAATTAEVVAGDLLEIPLGDIFRDSDGHSLTYTLVNAAQFGTQTKVGGSTLYVSEKDPGTYEPKIKATCSGGKSVTATLTVTVKPAPHGLDAQYNYDESPAKEVTVYVTISNDGVPIRGRDGTILCHKAITVPYFDLSQYGLDEFYRYHTANGEGKYVDNNIVERPTGLHLYIYLLERYFIGLPESQCCKGRYDRGGLEGFRLDDDVYYMDEDPAYTASLAALKITGSPTSLYMANFWGHDENLMYYEEVPKYHVIVPEGTQTVDITYGKDVDIYHADATAYGYETDLAADAVSSATIRSVTLESSYKANDDGTQTVATPVARYVRNADGTAMAVTLESGSGKNFRPVALFTFEYAKAEPDPEPEVKYGDVNGDGNINSTDAAILYRSVNGKYTLPDSQKAAADVNGDGAVNSTDAALIYRKANGKMSNFPAES